MFMFISHKIRFVRSKSYAQFCSLIVFCSLLNDKAKWVKSRAHGHTESVPDNWLLFIWTDIHTKQHQIQHSVHVNRIITEKPTTITAQWSFALVFYRQLLVEVYGWCVNRFLLLIPYHFISMCSNVMGKSGQQQ